MRRLISHVCCVSLQEREIGLRLFPGISPRTLRAPSATVRPNPQNCLRRLGEEVRLKGGEEEDAAFKFMAIRLSLDSALLQVGSTDNSYVASTSYFTVRFRFLSC